MSEFLSGWGRDECEFYWYKGSAAFSAGCGSVVGMEYVIIMEVMVESVSGGSVIIHCSKRLELSL